jgi:hypothetical protein
MGVYVYLKVIILQQNFPTILTLIKKTILRTMQNLILATKCNPNNLNPSWIHVNKTLTIPRATWTILIAPCLGREHLGVLG